MPDDGLRIGRNVYHIRIGAITVNLCCVRQSKCRLTVYIVSVFIISVVPEGGSTLFVLHNICVILIHLRILSVYVVSVYIISVYIVSAYILSMYIVSPYVVSVRSLHSHSKISLFNPYPTAFPYGNGMVLHFYQQQESSTTKTVNKVINKGLKTYV